MASALDHGLAREVACRALSRTAARRGPLRVRPLGPTVGRMVEQQRVRMVAVIDVPAAGVTAFQQ